MGGEHGSGASGGRPAVSVVMPFAGDLEQRRAALAALGALRVQPSDQLIFVDNCVDATPAVRGGPPPPPPPVELVAAVRERSPAHARNAGAARARNDWILFLDADTLPPADLLDRFFESPIDPRVGVVAGEIRPAPGARTLAGRYAARRNFLSQRAHLQHPFLPRASAANMLVRRVAFERIGGFTEGIKTAEDTDLCWRVQRAGWLIELRPAALVEHRYRERLGDLRRQWRAYAAGRAWLAQRYPEFRPSSSAGRALRRLAAGAFARAAPCLGPAAFADRRRRSARGSQPPVGRDRPAGTCEVPASARERLAFAALDCLLGLEELVGMRLENRLEAARRRPRLARRGAGPRRGGSRR